MVITLLFKLFTKVELILLTNVLTKEEPYLFTKVHQILAMVFTKVVVEMIAKLQQILPKKLIKLFVKFIKILIMVFILLITIIA